jgi:hypothetical protein
MSGKSKQKLPREGSQARRIYDYLKQGNTLTSYEAFATLGIVKFSNRISDLRNKYGIEIYQRTIRSPNNSRVRWDEFSLFPFDESGAA